MAARSGLTGLEQVGDGGGVLDGGGHALAVESDVKCDLLGEHVAEDEAVGVLIGRQVARDFGCAESDRRADSLLLDRPASDLALIPNFPDDTCGGVY